MTQPSALTPIVETDARNEVINHAMTEIEHTAPALDETAISQVVERVMDRMKDDIVAQIVKELAAKLGK
jgi:hypothetical protein